MATKTQRLTAIIGAYLTVIVAIAVVVPVFFSVFGASLRPSLFAFILFEAISVTTAGSIWYWFDSKLKFSVVVTDAQQQKLGFGIQVLNASIDDAHPVCNGTHFEWENVDGTKVPKADLIARDKPRFFYPFRIDKTIEEVGNQERMTLKIIDDTKNGAVIHQQQHTYSNPAQAKKEGKTGTFLTLTVSEVKGSANTKQQPSKTTPAQAKTPPSQPANTGTPLAPSSATVTVSMPLRPTEITVGIVGKGAEEANDYKLSVGIADPVTTFDQGNPKVSFSLQEMERSWFRWRPNAK
jgi:hypothetical protein